MPEPGEGEVLVRSIFLSVDPYMRGRISPAGNYAAGVSPNIDALAERGVVFERTLTAAPWTMPAMAAMVSGIYPRALGFQEPGPLQHRILLDSVDTLAERFRRAGEVESLADAHAAVEAGADLLLLDNQTVPELREYVAALGGRIPLEATGGVSLASVREIAETGVDRISIGALTHSAPAADVALEVDEG